MGDAVSRLMHLLNWGNGQYKELLETTKLCVSPYHFRYVPDKLFSIKKPMAFAYYGNAGKYIEPVELEDSFKSANAAKEVGMIIYETLSDLGINPINILNPFKQYESQVLSNASMSIEKHLEILQSKSDCSIGIARAVIYEIMSGIKENC